MYTQINNTLHGSTGISTAIYLEKLIKLWDLHERPLNSIKKIW